MSMMLGLLVFSRKQPDTKSSIPRFVMTMNITECSPINKEDGIREDGPWKWNATKFELLDGALDDSAAVFSNAEYTQLSSIGSLIRTKESVDRSGVATFELDGEPPLFIRGTAKPRSAGSQAVQEIGMAISDSAIIATLFLRSAAGAALLGSSPAVLEIGAGLGLVGIDLVRSKRARSVTSTDKTNELLNAMLHNAGNASASLRIMALGWEPGDPYMFAERNAGKFDVRVPP